VLDAKDAYAAGKKTLCRQNIRFGIVHLQEANWTADLHAMIEEEQPPAGVDALQPEPMSSRSKRSRKQEDKPSE